MNHSVKKGFSFGLTSGIITTLGLLIGLYASTHSKMIVIGGVLTIAIADAMSDALGIHISEEAENNHSHEEIWQATFSTFLTKFFFAAGFIIPILLFELKTAIVISIIGGLTAISSFSFYIAKSQKSKPSHVVLEHLLISVLVIVITFLIGTWVSVVFV